ncbi:MAG TPA: DNA polymerase III subunit delta [Lacipirellulaceae bacterium]|nr:DNA polymerase III subunit delta [Lacipirellulaceae bacterium]
MAKSTTKSGVVNALGFLAHGTNHPMPAACVVYGDDAYLKMEVIAALRKAALDGTDSEFGVTILNGREVQARDVHDALASRSLFGGGRPVVIVEDADAFVSEHRAEMEDLVARPATGILVLEVKSWPSNTRLAKAIAASGLAIECAAPKERQIKPWLIQRAKAVHDIRLEPAAADALLDLVPPELGVLVQEIDKLALVAGPNRAIDVKIVRENVGGWRTRAVWDMVDAAADGRSAEALAQLNRLITSGEKPHGLLPQMASSLRRFATAVELIEAAEDDRRRLLPREALAQAGVLPFKLADAERQIRQIGRQRAKQLVGWLLAADLAMKGYNSADDRARIELERLIVRLAKAPA